MIHDGKMFYAQGILVGGLAYHNTLLLCHVKHHHPGDCSEMLVKEYRHPQPIYISTIISVPRSRVIWYWTYIRGKHPK